MQRSSPQKVLVIACGMLAREILAVRAANGLDHVELTCLPAALHYRPDRIPAALDAAIREARARGTEHVFVGYADCGTGGAIDAVCDEHGVARLDGPHCFASYQGLDAWRAVEDADMTSFYITDFLCRQFDAFFIRPLGLDRHPELAKDYFGNYEKVVYLAQTDDPALDRVAEDAARMLGLGYERRFTGYGDIGRAIGNLERPRAS